MIKRKIALGLTCVLGAAVYAAPAPVTDLNRGGVEDRIDTLERMVNARANSQHRIQEQLDFIQDEVNDLRGVLETHNHQLEKILERQRELYLEIDKRISAVQQQPAVGVGSGAVTSPMMPVSESDAYDRAVNLILKDKEYDQAIPEFRAFLQRFPNSGYAANAHYWLGQLLFNKQDWAGASEQFQVLISTYPDSPKRADALFKLGVVEQKRNNNNRARQLFTQVVNEYPDSSSRKLAESRLNNLN